jgi:hypothetical protein
VFPAGGVATLAVSRGVTESTAVIGAALTAVVLAFVSWRFMEHRKKKRSLATSPSYTVGTLPEIKSQAVNVRIEFLKHSVQISGVRRIKPVTIAGPAEPSETEFRGIRQWAA